MPGTLLKSGMRIRIGAGFNLWTEEAHQITKALQKKTVEPFQLFDCFGEDTIKAHTIKLTEDIQRSNSFSNQDIRVRSLNLRINNSWIGILGEYAVGYLCQEAGIP